jgi:hypothetical protein
MVVLKAASPVKLVGPLAHYFALLAQSGGE